MAITVRDARADDSRFLTDMLVEAAGWRPGHRRPRVEVLADPHVTRYITGWNRPGDTGVVALDDNGDPVGAAWYRLFSRADAGYGFVSTGVPELTLGVAPLWRAQGIGRTLLVALLARARSEGYPRISLSVERDNHAHGLYVSEGFGTVASGPDADTMVRALQ